jgi:hypothetical protein
MPEVGSQIPFCSWIEISNQLHEGVTYEIISSDWHFKRDILSSVFDRSFTVTFERFSSEIAVSSIVWIIRDHTLWVCQVVYQSDWISAADYQQISARWVCKAASELLFNCRNTSQKTFHICPLLTVLRESTNPTFRFQHFLHPFNAPCIVSMTQIRGCNLNAIWRTMPLYLHSIL